MKTLQLTYKLGLILLLGCFTLASCSSDDDAIDDNSGDDTDDPIGEPIELDCGILSEELVLENHVAGTDYILPCKMKVNAPLIIEPGVTIAIDQGAGFEVNDYGDRTGAITALGTENDPIFFTGVAEQPGAWNRITIKSADLNNKFKHCIIEYAGGSEGKKPALTVEEDTKVEVQHTTIRKNKSDGVYVSSSANIEGWKMNTIVENQGYPMEIAARKIKFLDGTQSTYANNDKDQVYVNSRSIYNRGFIEDEVGGPTHTWQDPGIAFFIDEDVNVWKDRGNEKPGHLIIEEGCDIIFNEGYGLKVKHPNTAIEILGTPENPVNFSGLYGAGSWYGINIRKSNSNLNTIENTTIADAGEDVWNWFDQTGGISLGDQTDEVIQLNMTNVHITNTAGCGVVERGIMPGSNIIYDNVTYSQNTSDDVCEESGL